jgi:hypothetical protein
MRSLIPLLAVVVGCGGGATSDDAPALADASTNDASNVTETSVMETAAEDTNVVVPDAPSVDLAKPGPFAVNISNATIDGRSVHPSRRRARVRSPRSSLRTGSC